jgi:hypothetical protein
MATLATGADSVALAAQFAYVQLRASFCCAATNINCAAAAAAMLLLTGDSLPVMSISDFQMISADVTTNPARIQ